MAYVIVTLKIMPEGVDVSLTDLEKSSQKIIENYGGRMQRVEKEPIGFGLVALKITFSMDENKGSTDALEDQLKEITGIMNVEVVNVGRALG
ncbi:MAG TPA: elongation factor 1-beta [Candidatus Nanoarchaeia archaeon]|nr:elongation factor 1-beta [Candidatus Nanoarchaeia archaeon]